MRTLTVIIGCIVVAIAIDVMLGLLDPHRLLPTQLCATIGDWGMTASLFLIPALFVFAPAKSRGQRSFGLRIPLAVLVSWFATLEFRMQFNLPALRELARERDDYMYDGVGMNAALLVMGWVPPLIMTLILVVLLQFTLAIRKPATHDRTNSSNDNATVSAENAK